LFWRDAFKRIKKKSLFETVAVELLFALIRFVHRTIKWTEIGGEIPESYHKAGKPFVGCLWHDRLMLSPCFWRWKTPIYVLASSHGDGRLIAKIAEKFSMRPVFGSTGKGIEAAKKLIKLVRAGEYITIIPDGPRGPRHKLAPGVVAIAKLANADIVAFSFCVKKYRRFNSWDRFIFALPFNRGAMVWKKISIDELKNISEEEAISLVERNINMASEEAYRVLCNA
jgi:lysophospholipid acyltransferase (LPLAT)-like uncharacterized protein